MNRLQDDFLPREYIEHQQDRRLHAIALALLFVVLASVGAAWWVKRGEWHRVQESRADIEAQYADAAQQADRMADLIARHTDLMARSMLAASLVDRLPRSVLLAEFINRLPESVGLMEFDVTTELIEDRRDDKDDASQRSATAEEAKDTIEPRRWKTSVSLLGFAPTDVHVSAFLAELNAHSLLDNVTLSFSEETEVNDVEIRRFRITAELGPQADVRFISPRLSSATEEPLR